MFWGLILLGVLRCGSSQCQLPVCKSEANCPNPKTENPSLFDTVCLHDGTEYPFTGALLHSDYKGVYHCACCNHPLFNSTNKFDSGTGWPSFYDVHDKHAVTLAVDNSDGDTRIAVSCAKCGAHLGHVFNDGPPPTGLRYCMNSVCLHTGPLAAKQSLFNTSMQSKPTTGKSKLLALTPPAAASKLRRAVFSGGCFWGIQLVFESIIGVQNATAGYTGGTAAEANYATVSTGKTNHAESVEVLFDPTKVTYAQLLDVFFHIHNPTTLNYQDPDEGPQYRSAIWTTNKSQNNQATKAKQQYQTGFRRPIVTQINTLGQFYPAEQYHQDFARRNPQQGYIVMYDWPKYEEFKAAYPNLVKPGM